MKKKVQSNGSSKIRSPFHEYLKYADEHPHEFNEEMKLLFKRQKKMLKMFDFVAERGKKCCDWIEKYCVLTEGQNAGEPVKLLLWQKWLYYSILCFYGNIEAETFDVDGKYVGKKTKYSRIVNDVLLVIATGNSKTTTLGFFNAYVMFNPSEFPSAKIFIGSNSYKQSKRCFDTTKKIIAANKILRSYASIRNSQGQIEIEQCNTELVAMSSDGTNLEGIIPAVLEIDEIHEMKNSAYADNLRKSTKRDDFLIIETTTQGTVRGGYLDQRIELAENTLRERNDVEEYRKLFVIYKQDNEQEIYSNDVQVLKKSNPSLSVAVSVPILKDKIIEMINDPAKRIINLTKNFNIPQNPITSYFSERECKTKAFDEKLLYGAPIFLGFDMAYTRNPNNDLTALELLMVNPFTNEEYCKDIYFLPKYWEHEVKDYENVEIVREDMAIVKSKEDSNILYNPKQEKYGYKLYAKRGDVVIVDEELIETLVQEFGEQARCDCTGITEEFVEYYVAHLELKYNWTLCKIGLDPNKFSKGEAFFNENVVSLDGKYPVVKFKMEDKKNSNPIILSTKDIRARQLVYNNNKLSELHFAAAQAKQDQYGNITFTNSQRERKDGVIINLAARSAYNVFINNKDTGASNLEMLKRWWVESGNYKPET